MSRIHEALKRAEQERGKSSEALSPKDSSASAVPAKQNIAAGSAIPFLASEFTFDALITRCPQNQWSPDLATMLFFNSEEQLRGTEEFRTLRSRLYQLRESRPLKKILVTSALPREGKSFIAANLAQVLVRQHGRRALLIDGDLRASRLRLALGTPPSPGLAEYLSGEVDEFAIMQRGPMENLFFISSGRTMSNPAELVANGKMKVLLDRVESIFDWIIIDSPPAVPVSDAGLLANDSDGVLMVVRSQATPFDIARKAQKEFRAQQLVGVVLNAIETRSLPYSRYYYPAYGRSNGKAAAQR
jgi:protein-tyrosine kinase